MGKIAFYEDRNFQGRSYECMSDCSDLSSYFSRCHSIRVESGCFMIYERPNYMGHQYFLRRGEYPEYEQWMGFNCSVRSCQMIPVHSGPYRMRLYDRADCSGRSVEFMDDCLHVSDRIYHRPISSCSVMDGYWIFYEHPNFRGRQRLMRPGEYRGPHDWWGTIGSFRRATDF